jgi:membrane protease YdiL (CAAX protease family)
LLLQTILTFLIGLIIGIPIFLISLAFPNVINSLLVGQVSQIVVITASVFIARLLFDRRSIASLGLKLNLWAFKDLLVGILITLPMMGLIYVILWAAGWLTFESFAWQTDSISTVLLEILITFVVFTFVGWNEELLSRGYHLQTLESGLNTFWAVLLSSAVFGVMHLGNPNAESKWFVTIGILLAGIFLAYGYLRTRQLWLPIGLHIGWNFFEGAVFGFPVSGLSTYRLTRVSIDGPKLWTGGSFGPEAGLVLIPGLILGFALIYIYTRGRLEAKGNHQKGLVALGDLNLPE